METLLFCSNRIPELHDMRDSTILIRQATLTRNRSSRRHASPRKRSVAFLIFHERSPLHQLHRARRRLVLCFRKPRVRNCSCEPGSFHSHTPRRTPASYTHDAPCARRSRKVRRVGNAVQSALTGRSCAHVDRPLVLSRDREHWQLPIGARCVKRSLNGNHCLCPLESDIAPFCFAAHLV
jgi:hypothetical protein